MFYKYLYKYEWFQRWYAKMPVPTTPPPPDLWGRFWWALKESRIARENKRANRSNEYEYEYDD